MTGIVGALSGGYSAQQILKYLSQQNPQLAQQISSALNAGHSLDHVLRFISRNEKKLSKLLPDKKQDRSSNLYKTAQSEIHPSLIGAAKTGLQALAIGGTAAVGAGALAGVGRGLGTAASGTSPGALGVVPGMPGLLGPGGAGNALGAAPVANGAAIQGAIARAVPSSLQQMVPQIAQGISGNTPSNTGRDQVAPVQLPDSGLTQATETQTPTPTNLEPLTPEDKAIGNIQERRKESERLFELAKSSRPGKEATTPFMRMARSLVKKGQIKDAEAFDQFRKYWQVTEDKHRGNPSVEFEKFRVSQPRGMVQEESMPQAEESTEVPEAKIKPIAKMDTVFTPQGIGQIKEIRNGKALVDIDGKKHQVAENEIEKEPEDLEPVVRDLFSKIPEKMKSTAIQSAIRVPASEELNKSVTLVKFYNGDVAWYLDVPEDIYDSIALGTYEPKGQGRTGIAQYKPGIIDSRGAGFSQEISRNPKYAKDLKGKTWGYAKSSYDALQSIQPIINKISKEKYEENGNLITAKRKQKTKE